MLLKTRPFLVHTHAPHAATRPAGTRPNTWRLALLSGVAFLLATAPHPCAAAPQPTVKTAQKTASPLLFRWGLHDNFERLAIDLPAESLEKTGASEKSKIYTLTRTPDTLAIRFKTKVSARLPRLTTPRHFTEAQIEPTEDGFTLHLRLSPQTIVKDRLEGRIFVLDLSSPVAAPSLSNPATPEPTATETATATATATATPAATTPTPAATPAVTPTTAPKTQPTTTPSQTPPPTPTPPAVSPTPKAAEQETPSSPLPTALPPSPSPAPVIAVSATPLPLPEKPLPEKPSVSALRQMEDARALPPNAPLELKGKTELVASFDAKTPLSAAVFARGGFVTILFDRKITLPPTSLVSGAPLRVKLYPVDLPRNTGFRFAIPLGLEVSVTHEQTAWKIAFTRQSLDASLATGPIPQPDFALGARLLLPMASPSEPILYTDPLIGDPLIVIPTLESQTFPVLRSLADLQLLPAAQGFVIKPLQEKVIARRVTDGLEITAEGGLRLSPSTDTGSETTQGQGHGKLEKRLFDLSLWRGKPDESFTKKLQRHQQNIVEVQPKDRLLARLELARFYFAYGMAEEALSILGLLEKDEPDFVGHPDYLALRGATRVLTRQVPEGLQDLSIPALADLRETDLWKAVALAELRDWTRAYEKFLQVQDLLKSYPKPFRIHFIVLATESALAANKDKDAEAWLSALKDVVEKGEIPAPIAYLQGALASRAGDADKAAKFWREASKGGDKLYKIRAELALIDLAVATNSLTAAQAAERLEGLRFAWRGDDLELDILNRLGGFYMDARNYRAGLQVYGLALRLYPNAPMSPDIRDAMTTAYRNLFLGEEAEKLSPIEALTIYQEFAYLKPKGEGYKIGRKLVERLVAIDLLDQAARILEIQLKNGLAPEERAPVGTRLAGIYLLDHNAEKALTALAASEPEAGAPALPEPQSAERTLLRARALLEQKKIDEALNLLNTNKSPQAQLLRTDILMKGERWSEAAKALIDLAGPPPKAGTPSLTTAQADILVNAATAAALAQDTRIMDQLALDYGAAMEKTGLKDMFRVLTRPDKVGQVADLRAASARIADIDLFRKVLDTYRETQTEPKTP